MKESENYEEIINHKNDEFVHYQKINIFGDDLVGKTSFILYLENYDDNEYSIKGQDYQRAGSNISFNINNTSLINDIKRFKVDLNQDRYLNFYTYETSLNKYEIIKMNLDVLLVQTECIIVIWDNSCPETFEHIPDFISAIESGIQKKIFLDVPIFVIQNKIDSMPDTSYLTTNKNDINKKIKDFKNQHPKVVYKELSLYEKDPFYEFVLELYQEMQILEKSILRKKNDYKDNDIYNIKFKFPLTNLIEGNGDNDNEVNPLNTINCLLLGNSGVGKTSFIKSLLGIDITKHLSTIGTSTSFIKLKINEETMFIKINDTAGQERLSISLPQSYYKKADNILLFYDITNKESYNNINNWIKMIINEKGKINDKYELFLIGNKIDKNDNRVIEKKTAKKLAEKYNVKYFECSCLNAINIYEILNEIALIAYKKDKKDKKDYEDNKHNKHNKNNKTITLGEMKEKKISGKVNKDKENFQISQKELKKQKKNCC